MQMLRISSERRARLLADGLLAINARSQEVLHGLTFEESQFLIDFDDDDGAADDEPSQERRSELSLRHEQARLRIVTADDESSADEEQRPRAATKF
ncbi:hypothetical protein [Variovorax sp. V15]|uniref:hypothetical protein n=1 Tax=unclassified Variovorax TaxID=663243 RepID=UPI0034E88033